MRELSLVELESELSAVLPTRNLMRRKRCGCRSHGHGGNGGQGGTSASFGSGANGNTTAQQNVNPQTVVNTGGLRSAGIRVSSFNRNDNSNSQTATPINFGVGL